MIKDLDEISAVYMKEDPIMREVPDYSQKERIRSIIARQQAELKNLTPSTQRLESIFEQFRKGHNDFWKPYDLAAQQYQKQVDMSSECQKAEQKELEARKIAESFKEKYKQQYAEAMKTQADNDKAFQEELAACQKELSDKEAYANSLKERMENAQGHNKNLLEHRESFLGEIDKLTTAKETEVREKKELVTEMQQKIEESLDSLNFDDKPEEDPAVESAREFREKYSAECTAVVEEWENFSSSELEKCLGPINLHIEKIQKLRPGLESAITEYKTKLWGSLNRLAEKAEENISLRNKILAEKKKQTAFEQMKKDLEAKING